MRRGIFRAASYELRVFIIMMTFCTLFDSFYLDKAIALYRSLDKCAKGQFRLYFFCFDDKAYDVLESMSLDGVVLIKSTVFDNDTMRRLKKERTKAEYCWTCTPQSIEYVLDRYDEESVTYIDADLYFFSNPKPLFDEIHEANANVTIVEHRFADNHNGRKMLKRSGKYCVEFNYFDQTEESRKCLAWWRDKCIEWCYHLYEPDRMGDQKYLMQFPKLFKGVHELQHLGGGVAPWNLAQYRLDAQHSNNQLIHLLEKDTGKKFVLVFYHFQNLRYIGKNHVNVYSGTHNKRLKDTIYIPYLKQLESIREELMQFNITFNVKKVYSSNKFIAFAQATILRFKIKSLSDVYNLDKIRRRSNT